MLTTITGLIDLFVGWVAISIKMIVSMYMLPFESFDTLMTWIAVISFASIPGVLIMSIFTDGAPYKYFKLVLTAPLWIWIGWSMLFWGNPSNYNF